MNSALPNEWATEPCLDLVNTRFADHLGSGRMHDRLPLPAWRRGFLRHWNYEVEDPDDAAALARLRTLRRLLRTVLEAHGRREPMAPSVLRALEREINRAPLVARISGGHGVQALVLERAGRPWDAVTADIATSAVRLMGEGRRVKVCSNPSCTWMFEDRSRSGSRRWCDVSICGSLINVRCHRRAHAR